MSSAQLSSGELLLKHFLSVPDPWAGEAGVSELDLRFCPLPPSSQKQGAQASKEGLWPQGLGMVGLARGLCPSAQDGPVGQVGSKAGPSLVPTAPL